VGSEIVQQVRFPYPVAPIVRSHHEKWDGSGYPDGLSGNGIPIGARILAAVDCLDALASDRQYRRALPLDEAMSRVEQEAGTSFDPNVVALLKARFRELEQQARTHEPEERTKLSTDVKVERGAAPAAGFASEPVAATGLGTQERSRKQPARDVGSGGLSDGSMSLPETLSAVAIRLRHSIPYDALVVFGVHGDILVPHFVLGENFRELSALRVAMGQGLTGWVAETGKPMVNGNPAVEPGYAEGPTSIALRSALAVPVQGTSQTVAVLALYHAQPEAFSYEHLGILEKQGAEIGTLLEKCLKREQKYSIHLDPFTRTSERARGHGAG
jgi:GAF domain-containing protein